MPGRRGSSQSPILGDFKLPSEPLAPSFWTTEHLGLPDEILSVMQAMHGYLEMIKAYVRGTMICQTGSDAWRYVTVPSRWYY